MSRRKQYKPKHVQDDEDEENDVVREGDDNDVCDDEDDLGPNAELKKRKRSNDENC